VAYRRDLGLGSRRAGAQRLGVFGCPRGSDAERGDDCHLADAQRIDRERIAILEEANRNVRESLQRIESVVNEIRDRRRQ
jgi:hypothetical protein